MKPRHRKFSHSANKPTHSILISCHSITNYCILRDIKQYLCIISQLRRSKVQPDTLSSPLCVSEAKIKVSACLGSNLEPLGENPLLGSFGCGQNLVLWGCRTVVPISLLAGSWDPAQPRKSTFPCSALCLQTGEAR